MTTVHQILVDSTETSRQLWQLEAAVGGTSLKLFMRDRAIKILQERTQERFDTESFSGGKWQPLTWLTNRFRVDEGYQPVSPINVRTGSMKDWLTNDSGVVLGGGSSASVQFPGPAPDDKTEKKFRTAQRGRKGNDMPFKNAPTPARPVVEIDTATLELMLMGLTDWIEDGTYGGNFGSQLLGRSGPWGY